MERELEPATVDTVLVPLEEPDVLTAPPLTVAATRATASAVATVMETDTDVTPTPTATVTAHTDTVSATRDTATTLTAVTPTDGEHYRVSESKNAIAALPVCTIFTIY